MWAELNLPKRFSERQPGVVDCRVDSQIQRTEAILRWGIASVEFGMIEFTQALANGFSRGTTSVPNPILDLGSCDLWIGW